MRPALNQIFHRSPEEDSSGIAIYDGTLGRLPGIILDSPPPYLVIVLRSLNFFQGVQP
jgi:hypothetical protein